MMTVKEVCKVLKDAKNIMIGYGTNAFTFNKDDALMLDAYGSYLVDEISSGGECCSECYYEITIAVKPIKEVS